MNSTLFLWGRLSAGSRQSWRLCGRVHMPINHILGTNLALFAPSSASRIHAADRMSLRFLGITRPARNPWHYPGVILTPGHPWDEPAC